MRPEVVLNHDKYMGGVDRSDQMLSYSTFQEKTLKWWKRVTFHVISLTILNSYIVYKEVTADRVPMLQRLFIKKLIHIVSEPQDVPGMSNRTRDRPSTAAEPIQSLQGRHFPCKIVGTGKKKNITRSCVVCAPVEREL